MSPRAFFLPLLLALSGFLASCGGGDDFIRTAHAAGAEVVEVRQLHAVLRPDANGRWYVQSDVDHSPIGISWGVEQTSEFVRIFFFENFTHAGVIQITSDDDFAGRVRGYSNLGLNNATIRIEVDGRRIDPARILDHVPTAARAGNLWVSVTMVNKRAAQ